MQWDFTAHYLFRCFHIEFPHKQDVSKLSVFEIYRSLDLITAALVNIYMKIIKFLNSNFIGLHLTGIYRIYINVSKSINIDFFWLGILFYF